MRRSDPTLRRDLEALASSAMRRHGRTFFLASLMLGGRREGVEALYRLCRYVDDIADECSADDGFADETSPDVDCAAREYDPHAALIALDGALRRQDATQPFVRVALRLREHHGLPIAGVHRLIHTAAHDAAFVRPSDFDALLRYAFGVAGVVGWMLRPMLGARDPRAAEPAVALGIAMQFTNIARDVVADARIGRIYLPQTWAPRLSAQALAAGDAAALTDAHAAALRLLDEAERFYALAERGIPLLPAPPRWSIRAAARMYREIGAQVRAVGASGSMRRAVVGPWRKSALLLACAAGAAPRFGRDAWDGLPESVREELQRLEAA
jgi:15-cis-phytoene synthase